MKLACAAILALSPTSHPRPSTMSCSLGSFAILFTSFSSFSFLVPILCNFQGKDSCQPGDTSKAVARMQVLSTSHVILWSPPFLVLQYIVQYSNRPKSGFYTAMHLEKYVWKFCDSRLERVFETTFSAWIMSCRNCKGFWVIEVLFHYISRGGMHVCSYGRLRYVRLGINSVKIGGHPILRGANKSRRKIGISSQKENILSD